MSRLILSLAIALSLIACDSESKPAAKKSEPVAKEPPAAAPAPVAVEPPAEEKEPEPSTPEEIELARKAALMEGRDKDAFKYCKMAGIESGKSDSQALLGCALAACRIKDVEQARAWAADLPKALEQQAKKICKANGVGI
jgi:hypothetical protein